MKKKRRSVFRRASRPLLLEALEQRALLATIIVNTADDNGSDVEPLANSLRAAILEANRTVGFDTIDFQIGTGPQTITLVSNPLPAITEGVAVDGRTQPGYTNTPLISIRPGSGVFGNGLTVYSGGSVIQGLNIGGFSGYGILLAGAGGNTVASNYLGTNQAGTAANANGFGGLEISGSPNNEVTGNLISGNGGDGVQIDNNNDTLFLSQSRQVQSTASFPFVPSGPESSIYQTTVAIPLNNLNLSGNGYTLEFPSDLVATLDLSIFSFDDSTTGQTEWLVTGVYTFPIFTATLVTAGKPPVTVSSSSEAVASFQQVLGVVGAASYPLNGSFNLTAPFSDATGTVLGVFTYDGLVPGTIAINDGTPSTFTRQAGDSTGRTTALVTGLEPPIGESIGNVLDGNSIGSDVTGNLLIPNSFSGVSLRSVASNYIGTSDGNLIAGNAVGVLIAQSSDNWIQRNTIVRNEGGGVEFANFSSALTPSSRNVISGNFIGTNAAGASGLGNGLAGIRVRNAADNTINNNVIVGSPIGVDIAGLSGEGGQYLVADGNTLTGNVIGLNPTGAAALPNGVGVRIAGASNNTLTGNLISGNSGAGVYITIFSQSEGPNIAADGNALYSNLIGTDPRGLAAFPNGTGVLLEGATHTVIGGLGAGEGNIISGNVGAGVAIANASFVPSAYLSSFTRILGNLIGVSVGGTALPNGLGVSLNESSDNLIQGNTIAGNRGDGVALLSYTDPLRPSARNWIQGNFIGTNAAGAAGLGNAGRGVVLQGDATGNTVVGNVIAGNATGVEISSDDYSGDPQPADGNTLSGNLIGLNPAGTLALPNGVGVLIAGSSGNTLRGNVIAGNTGAGVYITIFSQTEGPIRAADGNVLYANLIGTNPQGGAAFPNGTGVLLEGATHTVIGGLGAGEGNIISGNVGAGVAVDNASIAPTDSTTSIAPAIALAPIVPASYLSSFTQIVGNLIGVSAGGAALPNDVGVSLVESSDNWIQNNTIAGNRGVGVALLIYTVPLRPAARNLILGNLIGTTAAGAAGLGNGGRGVVLHGDATANIVNHNVIAGNATGVEISSGASQSAGGNTVADNRIGVAPSSNAAIANGVGVLIADSSDNILQGNVISGNTGDGVALVGLGDSTRASARNQILSNRIGTDASGNAAIPNGGSGVLIYGASYNFVGDLPGFAGSYGNVLSGNAVDGVQISSPSAAAPAVGNVVLGNLVGTNGDGTAALGNLGDGVHIINGSYNTIGGVSAGDRNVISGNRNNGVTIDQQLGLAATGNVLDGNLIGTDAGGLRRLGNAHFGVLINNAQGNAIGRPGTGWVPGTLAPATPSNVISGNDGAGVGLFGTATGNAVQGNYIGVSIQGTAYDDAQKGLNLNNPIGVAIYSNASGNLIGGSTAGSGNIITQSGANSNDQNPANGVYVGVVVGSPTALGNAILGNLIGVDALSRVGSNLVGVLLQNSQGTLVGGFAPASSGSTLFATAGNLISGNSLAGIEITGLLSSGNLIRNNFIGTDVTGYGRPGSASPPLPNPPLNPTQESGVLILQGTGNQVGAFGAGNLLSGNRIGVNIASQAVGDTGANQIRGNTIGVGPTGTTANPNFEFGVFVTASANNVIDGNLISANGLAGIEVFGGSSQFNPGNAQSTAAGLGTLVTSNRIGVDANGQVVFAASNGRQPIDSIANHPTITLPDGIPVFFGFQEHGVVIIGASNNTIGLPGQGNLISGNIYTGVYISRRDNLNGVYALPVGNVVQSNSLTLDGIYGVFRYDAPNGNPVFEQSAANANTFTGTPIPIADFVTGLSQPAPPGQPIQSILLPGGGSAGAVTVVARSAALRRRPAANRTTTPRRQAGAVPNTRLGTSTHPRIPRLFEPGATARNVVAKAGTTR